MDMIKLRMTQHSIFERHGCHTQITEDVFKIS